MERNNISTPFKKSLRQQIAYRIKLHFRKIYIQETFILAKLLKIDESDVKFSCDWFPFACNKAELSKKVRC